jgi:predicted DNA-binding transcriptional regulator AlpA
MAPSANQELLTIRDVARHFSVSERTIWRWVTAGKLPAPLRFSTTCLRWRARDIERYVEQFR